MEKCLLILDHEGGKLADSSVRMCVHIERSRVGEMEALVFGDCPSETLTSLGGHGVRRVYRVPGKSEDFYSAEQRVEPTLRLISEVKPSMIILPATLKGREMAPLLAARLEAGFVTDCVQINVQGGRVEAVLSIYGGQYQMISEFTGNIQVIQMADVNPGAIAADVRKQAAVFDVSPGSAFSEPALRFLETFRLPAAELDIGEADVVVGVGRGVKTKEDLSLMEELARTIGAPVGGTRPAVDLGWITFERQIGQTGRIVAPELYFAAGISGAVQHITGVEKAKIVAINNDPQAPILRLADLGVIGDLRAIMPLLIKKLRETREERQP